MALNAFLKIDGIEGASAKQGHEKEVELEGFGISVHNSGSRHTATGGGVGQGDHGDLSFQMMLDKSAPNIHQACMTGQHIKEITLFALKASGDAADPGGLKYVEFVMKDCLISSFSWSGAKSGDVMASGSINFAEYEYKYTPQATEGGGEGDITAAYHIAEGHPV